MNAECPDCHKNSSQGSDYGDALKRVEAGKFTYFCCYCRHEWKPTLREQQLLAEDLRKLMAQS